MKGLHDRISQAHARFSDVEQRLDHLEHGQSCLLELRKRCESLHARQTAILSPLDILQGIQHQTPTTQQSVPSSATHGTNGYMLPTTEARLAQELTSHHVSSYNFKRVPSDYYSQDLEYRCKCLQAASIQHLCKSLILENTHLPEDRQGRSAQDSRYYLVIVQYAAKFHGEKLKRYIHKLNGQLGIQYFRLTFAAPETSEGISGYAHGSVTPVGIKTEIPVILSDKIVRLRPDFFWMGGGEEDLKLGMTVTDFVNAYKPLVVDCTY